MIKSKKHMIIGPHSFILNNKKVWAATCACGNFSVLLQPSAKEATRKINKHIKEKTGGA